MPFRPFGKSSARTPELSQTKNPTGQDRIQQRMRAIYFLFSATGVSRTTFTGGDGLQFALQKQQPGQESRCLIRGFDLLSRNYPGNNRL